MEFAHLYLDDLLGDRKNVDPAFSAEIPLAYVVEATNVSDYYFMGTDQEVWDIGQDFPTLTPPLDRLWIECRAPEKIISAEYGEVPWPDHFPLRWGCYLYSEDEGPDTNLPYRWKVGCSVCADHRTPAKIPRDQSKMGNPLWHYEIGVAPDGGLARLPNGDPHLHGLPVYHNMGLHLHIQRTQGEAAMRQVHALNGEHYMNMLKVALLAINFMHCRNVAQEQIQPPTPAMLREDRRLNRWPKAPRAYHILHINPMREIIAQEQARQGGVSVQRALHIVRGGFRNYEEGRGLFGKWHGRYWVPQHVRGSADMGIIDKGYKIDSIESGG